MIIAYMSGIIACFELTLALIKYYTESKRKKYNITIEKCSILIENIYNLRSLYLNIEKSSEKDLFNPEIISNSINKPIKKEMMRTLTIIEGIAEGMEKNVFDYRLYIDLMPKEIIEMYKSIQKFIIKERENLQYTLLFDKSERFIRNTEKDFNKKMNNQHISKKYRYKRYS